ncbi:MAG TPA: ATP synthase F1 subunit gamma [Enhygromyxa sp.]|nr:ATP synthase F1 subunit gamma [Enhygromyxa sp.]
MANLKEIRNRIGSVKSTRKITSAMSRIAAARLRKAQTAMENARQYGVRMAAITGEILRELDASSAEHPLLHSHARENAVAIVVVTADRGLCGGFNSSVNRTVERMVKTLWAEDREVYIITIGRKGRDYLKSYNRAGRAKNIAHHPAPAKPEEVVGIAKLAALEAMALFQGNFAVGEDALRVGEVRLVFNYFKNVITQEVHDDRLLPVPMPEAVDADGDGQPDAARPAVAHAIRAFEPDTKQLLDHLLPVAVETAVQQALYNSVASEVAARRSAMDSATDNATELIGELTLQYNRERQAAITKELMEIIGGAEALKG